MREVFGIIYVATQVVLSRQSRLWLAGWLAMLDCSPACWDCPDDVNRLVGSLSIPPFQPLRSYQCQLSSARTAGKYMYNMPRAILITGVSI